MTILYSLWTLLSGIFACVPVRAFWTKEEGARCLDEKSSWFAHAAVNIFLDIALIVLPMPVIKSLNLGRATKRALYAVFALGGL
jgi:hypothetical protein